MLGTFTTMPKLPSLFKVYISLIGPILLQGLILRSNCPPPTLAGLPASPPGTLSTEGIPRSSGFLRHLQFYTEQVLCLSFRSLFRRLPFLFVGSKKGRKVSLCRRSFAFCTPNILKKVMLLLRGFPPLSEHNLRNCQLHKVDTE